MIPKLLLIDPLTLTGRELLTYLGSRDEAIEIEYAHTSDEDEHEIAELAGQAGLVPPLEDMSELDDAGVIVIASDHTTTRFERLADWIHTHPDARVVDAARHPLLRSGLVPTAGATGPQPGASRLRVAHPTLVALSALLDGLGGISIDSGHLVAVDPASEHGRGGVEIMAKQAISRLQGEPASDLIDGQVLAFNYLAADPDELAEDLATLVSAGSWSADRAVGGAFHGHVAHILLELAEPVDENEMRQLLEDDPRFTVQPVPLALDSILDQDQMLVGLPRVVAGGRRVITTVMVDGLRIGGAVTAVEALQRIP